MRLSAALVLSASGPGDFAPAAQSALDVLAGDAVFDDGWVSADVCWRALFSHDESLDLVRPRARIRAALASFPVDVNLVPDDLAFTTKRLVAADMESTLIEQEMIVEVAREIGVWGGDLAHHRGDDARRTSIRGLSSPAHQILCRARHGASP